MSELQLWLDPVLMNGGDYVNQANVTSGSAIWSISTVCYVSRESSAHTNKYDDSSEDGKQGGVGCGRLSLFFWTDGGCSVGPV